MLSWLRRTPAPKLALVQPDLLDRVADLERKVARVESERLDILTEWAKTRDQVLRYMKRAGAIRARQEAADELDPAEDGDELELDRLADRMRGNNGSR